MNYSIGFVSLGCEKNRVDMEIMMAKLQSRGFKLLSDPYDSDIVIINTCGFIDDAKQESINEIIEFGKLKKKGKIKLIIVTGCLAQRYREKIMQELPEVDAVIGIGANNDIVKVVEDAIKGANLQSFPPNTCMELEGDRVLSTPSYFTYLKIAEGCDNHCTYCAIPMIRGKFRSRPMESIISEAEKLAKRGVIELNIIAQDTTRYGEDIYNKQMLPELLRELCKVDGIKWIRVLYCYPDRVTDELLDVIADEPKIVKYMDLPLQHCNSRVLKTMNRFGNREVLTQLIEKVRNRVPGIVLRTTFMVGFPGETEEEFEELSKFINDMKFERMGCFAYSREEDTPAAKLKNQIPQDIKYKRQDIIMNQQAVLMNRMNDKLIGKYIKVLNEGFDEELGYYFGRSAGDAPFVDTKVYYKSNGDVINAGEFLNVKLTSYIDLDFIGEVSMDKER